MIKANNIEPGSLSFCYIEKDAWDTPPLLDKLPKDHDSLYLLLVEHVQDTLPQRFPKQQSHNQPHLQIAASTSHYLVQLDLIDYQLYSVFCHVPQKDLPKLHHQTQIYMQLIGTYSVLGQTLARQQ